MLTSRARPCVRSVAQGLIPGYGGHKREAKFSYGSSIYVNGIPKGGSPLDSWSGKNASQYGA